MKRKLLTTLLALLLAISMLGLFACGNGGSSNTGDNQQEQEQPNEGENQEDDASYIATEGLAYELSSDGKYYICTGMGTSTDTTVNIANVYKNLPVKEIKENAFSGCINVKNITIPSNIKNMGKKAFSNCTVLEEINFNATEMNDLVNVESEVFNMVFGNIGVYSEGVTVNIAKNVKRIPAGLFCPIVDSAEETIEGYNHIKTVKFAEDSVCEVIGFGAFSYCNRLENIIIPDSVTIIEMSAFYGCKKLQTITIPNSVTSIADIAFYECTSLKSVTIPNSVTSIGEDVFDNCTSLQYNEYGNGLYLGNNENKYLVLVGVKNRDITSCQINFNAKLIAGRVFNYCDSLESITVENGNTKYHSANNCLIETASKTLVLGCKNSVIPTDGSVIKINKNAFSSCYDLRNITIPNSVISIGEGAFFHCRRLESINIPNGVINIGDCTFESCGSLQSITIPASVTSIGNVAFYECHSLKNISFTGTKEQWNAISKGEFWNKYTGNYTIHCTDGDIAKS